MNCKSIQFGVVADVQYADKPTVGKRHYAESLQQLKACVDDFNRNTPAFVVQLGDLIDGGPNASAELSNCEAVYDQLRMPHYHVFGNHDFAGITRSEAMDILNLKQGYYAFEVCGWRFIVLDTQDVALEGGWPEDSGRYRTAEKMRDSLKAAGAPNANHWNGGISDEQLSWLTAELTDATGRHQPVIVFGHVPLRPMDDAHALWNTEAVVSILEKYDCVKTCFSGHKHSGGYEQHNGIHYITLEAMVNAADKDGAWATVTLSKDRMIVDGHGAVTSRILDIKK